MLYASYHMGVEAQLFCLNATLCLQVDVEHFSRDGDSRLKISKLLGISEEDTGIWGRIKTLAKGFLKVARKFRACVEYEYIFGGGRVTWKRQGKRNRTRAPKDRFDSWPN